MAATKLREKMAELGKNIKERQDKVSALFQEADEKQEGINTPEQREEIKSLNKSIAELGDELKELQEQQGERDFHEIGINTYSQKDVGQALEFVQSLGRGRGSVKTWGEEFTENADFKEWLKTMMPHGQEIPRTARIYNSPSIPIPKASVKTLLTGLSATSMGAFIVEDRKPIVDPGTFYRPLRIADLVTMGETSSDSVEYVREGTHTSNAAMVAEATATGGSSGSKPESAMVFSVVPELVKTLAHWIPATKRALQDVGQLRTYVDAFLRYGLMLLLENQIINGDGTGENFTGILNQSGLTSQAFDTDILTTTRKARTKVAIDGRAIPTAYVMHPNDVEALDLLTDNEERYYFGGPIGVGVPRLWGVPLIESEAIAQGTALVGQWNLAVVWDRMQIAILTSDSHADFFTRNMIAILAEMRAAFGVLRPAAFVEIDLTA